MNCQAVVQHSLKQPGYAMLLLLPTLLTVTLSVSMLSVRNSNVAVRQQQILDDAAQSLVSYAVTYIDSYKPTGAGPGHLPCPDTDSSPNRYQVQMGLHGDGPNPPCGKHTIAIGKLPRHISHAKHRYAFHLEDAHDVWYAVDTRFINNPVNRAVNPDTVGRIQLGNNALAAAVVFIPSAGSPIWRQSIKVINHWAQAVFQNKQSLTELISAVDHYRLIPADVLLTAVTHRVALWLNNRYHASTGFECGRVGVCLYSQLNHCGVSLKSKLLLLMLEQVRAGTCNRPNNLAGWLNNQLHDAQLENVSLKRHWFVRNNWWAFVDTKVDKQCESAAIDCSVSVNANGVTQRIALQVAQL